MKLTIAPEAAIHHSAGILNSENGADPRPASAAAKRTGSGNHSNAGTRTNAGAAASAKATRHPCACATGPVMAKLSITPTGTAIMKPAMARARRAAGTRSPIQLVAAGAQTASPIPTPRRVANKTA